MKKIIALALCFLFIVSAAGCGMLEKNAPEKTEIKVTTPELSTKELYAKFSEIINEHETTNGVIKKPSNADVDPNFEMLYGLSYVDLIDFNADGTEELAIVYSKPFDENYQNPYENSTRDSYMLMKVFANQGKDVVNVFECVLPSDEYRSTAGMTLRYGVAGNKTYTFNCMNYTLNMPEVEPEDYAEPNDYNQWFTADCYYEYDGEGFALVHKRAWQGETPESMLMFNDEVVSYNWEELKSEPIPKVSVLEVKLCVGNFEALSKKISDVKSTLASGVKKEYKSFDKQSKFSSYREIADYLLLKSTENSVRDNDGVYEIKDDNIVEKEGCVNFTVTFTYFDDVYMELYKNNPNLKKITNYAEYTVNLSTGQLYSQDDNILKPEYIW